LYIHASNPQTVSSGIGLAHMNKHNNELALSEGNIPSPITDKTMSSFNPHFKNPIFQRALFELI
jgi:hypothetical protein